MFLLSYICLILLFSSCSLFPGGLVFLLVEPQHFLILRLHNKGLECKEVITHYVHLAPT